MKLYNTLTRKKEEFLPLEKNHVGIYTCGPTVYWYQHIGNLRSYVFADILKRVFLYEGYSVKHIINVTDVGHLTSDANEGEDKIEKAAKKEHKTAKEISHYYFNLFERDLKIMNILEPTKWVWATEHIKEQIDLIKELEKKGFTYKTSDGIYFDTAKVEDYGKLAKLKIEDLEGGKRVSLGEKKNKTDFALWKFSEEIGKRQQEWESPWGIGFPGWHIECSAMASKYLGKQFDIHTGGEDHIPVHHTNEIAQSECAFGKKPWVKYWLHGAFLKFDNEKMSKSTGKILTLSELKEKGFDELDYRYFLLTAHYRKQLNFTLENLESARNSLKRLKNIIETIKIDKEVNKDYLKDFEIAIEDDLDMPKALQILWELVRDQSAKGKYKTIEEMDKVFGLDLLKKETIKIPGEVKKLVEERDKARKEKNWKLSDDIRDKIKNLGWIINDTPEGVKLEKNGN